MSSPEYIQQKPLKSVCKKCPLYGANHVNSWLVPTTYWPDEDGEVSVIFTAEAPGKVEDKDNETLKGPAGSLLRTMVRRILAKHAGLHEEIQLKTIYSGGQTGADQGGIEAAEMLGLEADGWVPRGWKTEKGEAPWLERKGLREHTSPKYQPRTILNVKETDGTVIFGKSSEGSRLTLRVAKKLGKPVLRVGIEDGQPTSAKSLRKFRAWLANNEIEVLNVAGNRESVNPGIQKAVAEFIEQAVAGPDLKGVGLSNIVRCRPIDGHGKDRMPTNEEQKTCSHYVEDDIKRLKPKVVVTLGNTPTQWFFPHTRGIAQSRGETHIKDGVVYLFTYHPSYVARQGVKGMEPWEEMKDIQKEWAKDIEKALDLAGIIKIRVKKQKPRKDPLERTEEASSETHIEVEDDFSPRKQIQTNAHYVSDIERFKRLVKKMHDLPKGSVNVIDTETMNLWKAYDNDMLSIQFAWDGKNGHVVPFKHPRGPWNADDLTTIANGCRWLFTEPTKNDIWWCFAGISFDLHQIRREFECELLSAPNIDVPQVAYLLNENRIQGTRDPECYYDGQKGLALAILANVYLGHRMNEDDKKDRASISRWPMKRFIPYAAGDVTLPWHILNRQLEEAEDQDYRKSLLRLVRYLYSPANLLVCEMEQNGFPVDLAHTERIKDPRTSPLILEMRRLMDKLKKSKAAQKANDILVLRAARGNQFLFGDTPWYFNPSKDAHRSLLFYDILGYDPLSFTENGQAQVDTEFYKHYGVWDDDEEPQNEAAIVGDWRGVQKMMTSFVQNFWKLVDPDRGHPDMAPDGRVRPQIGLANTTSGRPAVKKPALQQIPRATNAHRRAVKDMFTVDENNVLIAADLKANEVRWGAINAQAKNLGALFWDGLKATKRFRKAANSLKGKEKKIYQRILKLKEVAKFDEGKPVNADAKKIIAITKRYPKMDKLLKLEEDASLRADIHKQTASQFFDVPLKKVSKERRQETKSIVFGHIAARGVNAIAEQIGKSKEETQKLLDDFDRRFPGLARRLKDNAYQAEHRGYVEGPQGRRRRFARAIWEDPEEWVQAKARRQARNNSIQGAASDACLVAAFRLLDYIRKHDKCWKILNIVHDAIYLEAPIDEMRDALWAVEMCLTDWTMEWMTEKFGINFAAPLESDIEVGLSWGTYYGWNGTEPHIELLEAKIRRDHEKKFGHPGYLKAA